MANNNHVDEGNNEDDMEIWGLMPTLKPNVSRIILAWQRDKTDVVLSKETNNDLAQSANATPATTFSTTVEAQPITVSLDMAAVNLATATIRPSNEPTKMTRPVDSTSQITETPSQITTTSTSTSTTSTRRPEPAKKTATSLKPSKSAEQDPEEWIEQIHQTPRPYNAERDCGLRSMLREGRVVGGRDSQVGEFPWSVLIRETTLLGFFAKTKCGGALIDLKWVLTAAHCKPGMFGSLEVVVGENNLGAPSGGGGQKNKQLNNNQAAAKLKPIVRKVKRMIIHRDYNPANFDNDIALLELESPYQVQPHVVPICLPEKEESFIGQQAMVAGWGKLSFGGPVPSVLQVARLPVIGNKRCQEMYHDSGHIKIISDSFLCAGYASGGQDSCEGDSGGPLQIQRPHDGRWVLAGTVSHGIKCAEPNLPGIYIRISAYLPWIKAVTYQQDHNKRYGYRRQFSRTGSVQLA